LKAVEFRGAWIFSMLFHRPEVRRSVIRPLRQRHFTYKAAGVDAIFPGSAFGDIHTLSQQSQSRGAHFEAVGQVLLGMPPDAFL
jgi:hypothetical protein